MSTSFAPMVGAKVWLDPIELASARGLRSDRVT